MISYLFKQIGGMYADELLKKEKYDDAAKIYYLCNRNFEETCLKFMMNNTNQGLESIFL